MPERATGAHGSPSRTLIACCIGLAITAPALAADAMPDGFFVYLRDALTDHHSRDMQDELSQA